MWVLTLTVNYHTNSMVDGYPLMENYPNTISKDKKLHHFEIGEHHDGESCKYRVFQSDEFVASFHPGDHQYFHICQNPGKIVEELQHLLADQIETHQTHGIYDNVKN
jgi:hypothetical protein